MRPFERNVLQSIIALGHASLAQIKTRSGHSRRKCREALSFLRGYELIDKPRLGAYMPTEKGKIVLALLIGKESRARNTGRAHPDHPPAAPFPEEALAYTNGHG